VRQAQYALLAAGCLIQTLHGRRIPEGDGGGVPEAADFDGCYRTVRERETTWIACLEWIGLSSLSELSLYQLQI
jgi:hypothetical protein